MNNEKLEIEIKKHRKKRSLDENALFHVLVNKLARHYSMSDDEMKIAMNLAYGTIAKDDDGHKQGCKVPEGTDMKKFYKYAKWYKKENGCDCYLFYKETHTLDTKEMAQLIDGVMYECKVAGIETMREQELLSLLGENNEKSKK